MPFPNIWYNDGNIAGSHYLLKKWNKGSKEGRNRGRKDRREGGRKATTGSYFIKYK